MKRVTRRYEIWESVSTSLNTQILRSLDNELHGSSIDLFSSKNGGKSAINERIVRMILIIAEQVSRPR